MLVDAGSAACALAIVLAVRWRARRHGQLLNRLTSLGQRFQAFHLRTSDQYEIDLVIDLPRERWAIEVKLTTQPSSDDILRLEKTAELVAADQRFLVSQVTTSVQGERTASCNLLWLLSRLEQLPR